MQLFFTFTVFLILSLQNTSAQNNIVIKYYDSSWTETSEKSAVYFTKYSKADADYQATSYWVKSGKLKSVSFYSDTSFSQQTGVHRKYYETGQIEDSSVYNNKGQLIHSYYYYPNGKNWVNYIYDAKNGTAITNAYDINGKSIKNFIYFREAEFPGGNSEWQTFLSENVKSKVPIKKGAPVGQYQVVIRFIVDVNGKLADIKPETNLGFGMEEEAMRVIKKSATWIPAIWLNKPVKAYRRQPLTFVIKEE